MVSGPTRVDQCGMEWRGQQPCPTTAVYEIEVNGIGWYRLCAPCTAEFRRRHFGVTGVRTWRPTIPAADATTHRTGRQER